MKTMKIQNKLYMVPLTIKVDYLGSYRYVETKIQVLAPSKQDAINYVRGGVKCELVMINGDDTKEVVIG